MWKGYLEGETKNEEIAKMVPKDYVYLHTSGHATEDAICGICNIVGAKTIIPIHSERTDRFEVLKGEGRISGEVRRVENGTGVII